MQLWNLACDFTINLLTCDFAINMLIFKCQMQFIHRVKKVVNSDKLCVVRRQDTKKAETKTSTEAIPHKATFSSIGASR